MIQEIQYVEPVVFHGSGIFLNTLLMENVSLTCQMNYFSSHKKLGLAKFARAS
jgi:hypothetical protein